MLPRQFQWLTGAQDPSLHIKESSLQSGLIQLQNHPSLQKHPKKPTCSVKPLCMTLIKPLIGLRAAKKNIQHCSFSLRFSFAFLPVVCLLNNNIQNQVRENFLFPFKNTTAVSKNGSIGRTFFTSSFKAKHYLIFTGCKWQAETKPSAGHCVAFHCCNGLKMATSRGLFSGDQAAQLSSPYPRQTLRYAGTLRSADEWMRAWVRQ